MEYRVWFPQVKSPFNPTANITTFERKIEEEFSPHKTHQQIKAYTKVNQGGGQVPFQTGSLTLQFETPGYGKRLWDLPLPLREGSEVGVRFLKPKTKD